MSLTTEQVHAQNMKDCDRALHHLSRVEAFLRVGELCVIRHALESIAKRSTVAIGETHEQPSI
jgi:hypothetical protein